VTPKIKQALECIERWAVSHSEWKIRVDLVRAGITVARPLEQFKQELERRLPKVRHKSDKQVLEQDLRMVQEALVEISEKVAAS
jgi:hypothetical protein